MGAGIVLIAVVVLAILCGAAALPRGLLMVAFVTLIATAAELSGRRFKSHAIGFALTPAIAGIAVRPRRSMPPRVRHRR
jgi:hypothetical protein